MTLVRAGRLTAERVALAGYLDDARALATGIAPWVPAAAERGVWKARLLLSQHEFSPKQLVWLVSLCVEVARENWSGGSELDDAIALVRRWCTADVPDAELQAGSQTMAQAASSQPVLRSESQVGAPPGSDSDVVHPTGAAAFNLLCATFSKSPASDALIAVTLAGSYSLTVQDRQAEAVAQALLDPSWPPWAPGEAVP